MSQPKASEMATQAPVKVYQLLHRKNQILSPNGFLPTSIRTITPFDGWCHEDSPRSHMIESPSATLTTILLSPHPRLCYGSRETRWASAGRSAGTAARSSPCRMKGRISMRRTSWSGTRTRAIRPFIRTRFIISRLLIWFYERVLTCFSIPFPHDTPLYRVCNSCRNHSL